MKSTLAARMGIKAAVAALAVTSMGGVALAATGNMPSPLPGNGKTVEERAADKAARDAEKAADAAAAEIDKAAKDAEKATDKATREAAKAAEAHGFQGLCTAFLAHPADGGHGKWIDSTAFTRLRAAASTPDAAVDAAGLKTYCETLLADDSEDAPAEAPAEESTTAEVDGPGKAAGNHGKGKDAEHGKDGTAPNNATGKDSGALAKEKGQGEERSAAAKEKSQAGADHGSAGDNGKGAENGEAGMPHGQAGQEHPAARG